MRRRAVGLVAEVGTSKSGGGTGLHNKPVGCGASEAYAPGPDGEKKRTGVMLGVGVLW